MPVPSYQRHPELERNYHRDPKLGYEPPESCGFLRCLEHGYPSKLVRWHCHEEYELHLIVSTTGQAFVGDYIGHFSPGHLVLTGPCLPHNWISLEHPPEGVPLRDRVIQFAHEPLEKASEGVPEMKELLPLLERSKFGIEFFDLADEAEDYFSRIRTSKGIARFALFCEFMNKLAHWHDYRLLSSVQMQSTEGDSSLEYIDSVMSYLTAHYTEPIAMYDLCAKFGMTESQFSRMFRRATGNTFTDFLNRLRVHHACKLLMDTDRYISSICFDAGFNNVANFNRRFLEVKGVTPSQYRRQATLRFSDGAH